MNISDAQREVRSVFLGGFAGQLVSGLVWLVSAALATWRSPKSAIIALVAGGFFIFPLTQLLLRLMARPAFLPKGHPMNALAMQIAFMLPFNLPLVAAATAHHLNWFYPAVMILLGTHYFPFIFLYGMPEFGVLAALLIGAGLTIGLYMQSVFSLGAWLTAVALLLFAFIGPSVALRESKRAQPIGRQG
jgi:MFS family permease